MATREASKVDVQPKVAAVRERFLTKFSGNVLDDTYDSADVNWVKSCDGFIRCVLRTFRTGGDVDKSVALIDEILRFRAKLRLSSLTEADLNQTLLKLNAIFFHGKDKSGYDVMYLRLCMVKKGQFPLDDIKQFLAYFMNKHYMADPERPTVTLFDCTDAGVSNMDVDVSRFVVACNSTYFPELAAYGLLFKMGRALEVVWAIIKTFMNADQTANTHVVSRKNVQNYIPADQLLPHMIKADQ